MIDDVLTKVDRMSMAVSLEAREPLLDHKLLEFAARVPASLKLKDGQSKYLLRRVLEQRVPRSIIERHEAAASPRRSASGCAARSRRWPTSCCSTDGCATAASSTTAKSAGCGASIAAGRADHRHRLWQLVMLELWFREFIDKAGTRPNTDLAGAAAVSGASAADSARAPMSV